MIPGAREQGTIWTFGYIGNVAAAVVHATSHPTAANAVFNVGETTVHTKRRWAALYAAAAGAEFGYRIVPDEVLDDEDPGRPTFHIIVDNTRFERATGFTPPVPLEDAIARTYDWAQARPEALGARPAYAERERAADRYGQLLAASR